MSIYKSTLNTSKQKKEKKVKPQKIKTKQVPIIKASKYISVIILIISVACFVSLCIPSNFAKNFLLGMFGISAYPICLVSIFLLSVSLGKTKYEVNKKYVIYLSFALFFVLMIAHLILTTRLDIDKYSQYLSDTYALKTSGAGLVMSIFTYWMKKYLTIVGAYIFSIILLTVFIGLIVDSRHQTPKQDNDQPVKSKFDFGSMINGESTEDDVEITLKHKQENIKKQIAKQKLGMEAGSSTIISSSMRLEDIPDTPKKYKSKRDYILTPPDIIMPDYNSIKPETIERKPLFDQQSAPKNDIESKISLNSDIFITDTDDFYKDAKIIEGKDLNQDNKIQPINNENKTPINNPLFDNRAPFENLSPHSAQNISNAYENIKPITPFKIEQEQSDWNNNIKQIFNENKSVDIFEALDDNINETIDDNIDEQLNSTIEEDFDDIDENFDDITENIDSINEITEQAIKTNVYQEPHSETTEIKLPSSNTSEVVRSSTFTTPQNVYTHELVEEKKEENPLGRPKKHHAEYIKPPVSLLEHLENVEVVTDEECNENIEKLERVLEDFKINAKVKAVQVGPAVTRYEIGMPQGVSVKKVQFHADDIAMALASNGSIRIEAPIPGKNAVGIEVPNRTVMGVSLREMIESPDYQQRINPMSFVLGKDINGSVQFCNLDKMPHLLVAGSTGSGKSVCLNTMLISMIYKSSPEDLRLILIDPKTVEFSTYARLPHLLTPEIITTKDQTINALNWAIKEMEARYGLLQRNQVVNIKEYNNLDIVKNGEVEKLPYIVIVIDELGDLMIEAKREMEERIMKLAQKSRAAGIHLVIATQRPSVDVITGTIKANLPSRIAFALTNFADSKTVLDMGGAEKLLGKGDMLFKPSDLPEPRRVQGAYISSREVASVVKFIKENNNPDFDEDAQKDINQSSETTVQTSSGENISFDPVLKDALRFFIQANQASITLVQRRFGVGYARAARIIDQMEQNGFISPADGSKPRQVLISLEEFNLIFNS
ncbi:MAG: DNA translocase FtsK [Clostridia bacterium]